jgi:uncharacterized protein (TIGR02996 family)
MRSTQRAVERRLINEVLAQPEALAPRVVYADWLLEQGDPRGEFIALQCKVTKRPQPMGQLLETLRWSNKGVQQAPPPRHTAGRRAQALLEEHGAHFAAAALPSRKGIVRIFERGFLRALSIDASDLIKCGEVLFAREPVEVLRVRKLTPALARQIFNAPWFGRVRALALQKPVTEATCAALCEGPRLAKLEELDLSFGTATPGMVDQLSRAQNLPALTRLDLRHNFGLTWQVRPGSDVLLAALKAHWGRRLLSRP